LRRLDRGDSQAVQASSAFLLQIMKKCFSPRLARERRWEAVWIPEVYHAVQERERRDRWGEVAFVLSHPDHKNKDVARVGHPDICNGRSEKQTQVLRLRLA